MQEVVGLLEGRHVPVEVAHPAVEMWVSRADVADIALEMLHVYGLPSTISRQPFHALIRPDNKNDLVSPFSLAIG